MKYFDYSKMDNTQNIFDSCKYGDLDEVKNHIEKGVDLDAKNNDGNTPLIWASYYGKIEVVKFLVEKGADLEAKDKYGKICYYYLNEENKEIIDLLLKDIEERKMMIKPCKKRYPSGV